MRQMQTQAGSEPPVPDAQQAASGLADGRSQQSDGRPAARDGYWLRSPPPGQGWPDQAALRASDASVPDTSQGESSDRR